MAKRVFLMILSGLGIGAAPDAAEYGDAGCNTLKSLCRSDKMDIPNLRRLGLFNIDGVVDAFTSSVVEQEEPTGQFCRLQELSAGKDSINGHWELFGLVNPYYMPTFPNGFPMRLIERLEYETGSRIIVNQTYPEGEVLRDYGEYAMRHRDLILFMGDDSTCTICGHESEITREELFHDAEILRDLCQGDLGIGRIIARTFIGRPERGFRWTNMREELCYPPYRKILTEVLEEEGKDVYAIGQVRDTLAGTGITDSIRTTGNTDAMNKMMEYAAIDWNGLCAVDISDFDKLFAHRRNIDGFAESLSELDTWLAGFMKKMRDDDVLIVTSDHACDPGFRRHGGHTREFLPLLMYGRELEPGISYGTSFGMTFCADTILQLLGVPGQFSENIPVPIVYRAPEPEPVEEEEETKEEVLENLEKHLLGEDKEADRAEGSEEEDKDEESAGDSEEDKDEKSAEESAEDKDEESAEESKEDKGEESAEESVKDKDEESKEEENKDEESAEEEDKPDADTAEEPEEEAAPDGNSSADKSAEEESAKKEPSEKRNVIANGTKAPEEEKAKEASSGKAPIGAADDMETSDKDTSKEEPSDEKPAEEGSTAAESEGKKSSAD